MLAYMDPAVGFTNIQMPFAAVFARRGHIASVHPEDVGNRTGVDGK